ncbi:MAG TPA: hypothetical protein HPP83_03800 [Candidatus Hydrogenedentes bacterium]|nr:hypothetical protein [Candidatus Hydrogenedentota bacterium]
MRSSLHIVCGVALLSTLCSFGDDTTKGVQPGIFVLSPSPKVGEPVRIGIVVPAKDEKSASWGIYQGDSQKAVYSEKTGDKKSLLVRTLCYERAGRYSPLLVIWSNDGTPSSLNQTSIEARSGLLRENIDKSVGFLLGILTTVIAFVFQHWLRDYFSTRERNTKLKTKIGQMVKGDIRFIAKKPDEALPVLPDWFTGGGDTDWSWRLYTQRYEEVRKLIEEVHQRKLGESTPEVNAECKSTLAEVLDKLKKI